MSELRDKKIRRKIRHFRFRSKVSGTSKRPRLVVYKSLKYLYAQVIDDSVSKTLVSSSTVTKELKDKLKSTKNIDAALALGKSLAQKVKDKGIKKLVFDRNGYLYHGKIKALADTLREEGIDF